MDTTALLRKWYTICGNIEESSVQHDLEIDWIPHNARIIRNVIDDTPMINNAFDTSYFKLQNLSHMLYCCILIDPYSVSSFNSIEIFNSSISNFKWAIEKIFWEKRDIGRRKKAALHFRCYLCLNWKLPFLSIIICFL